MPKRTEADFLDWFSGADIYVGYARYGQLGGHGWVCVSNYDGSDELAVLVDNLDGGDIEALDAAKAIRSRFPGAWLGNSPDPAEAMRKMLDLARRYYFETLNAS